MVCILAFLQWVCGWIIYHCLLCHQDRLNYLCYVTSMCVFTSFCCRFRHCHRHRERYGDLISCFSFLVVLIIIACSDINGLFLAFFVVSIVCGVTMMCDLIIFRCYQGQSSMIWLSVITFFFTLVTSILLCGCETWTLLADSEGGIQAFETKCMNKLLCISYLEHKTNDWVRSKSNSLWVNRNLLWQLSWDGNLHGSGRSHVTRASPKPSFWAPWWVGDAVIGRGKMLDGQRQRTDVPARDRTAHNDLLQKTAKENLCWIVCLDPWRPNRLKDRTELIWTVFFFFIVNGIAFSDRNYVILFSSWTWSR